LAMFAENHHAWGHFSLLVESAAASFAFVALMPFHPWHQRRDDSLQARGPAPDIPQPSWVPKTCPAYIFPRAPAGQTKKFFLPGCPGLACVYNIAKTRNLHAG